MIFGWLMKRIFVDKQARETMAAAQKSAAEAPRQTEDAPDAPDPEEAPPVEPDDAGLESPETEREKLIRETMSLYRKRRTEYEKLDSKLRNRINKAAREAFGDKE